MLLPNLFSIDDVPIQDHRKPIVSGRAKEALVAYLNAEAKSIAGTGRYGGNETLRDALARS